MLRDAAHLVELMQQAVPPNQQWTRLAHVTTVNVGVLYVSFDDDGLTDLGAAIETPATLASTRNYTPTVGDWVVCLRVGNAWCVLDSIDTTPLNSFTGTALKGAYDATKPERHMFGRLSGTSDASGFVSAAMPAGATNILYVTLGMNLMVGHTILQREDTTSLSTLVFQLRSSTTPFGALAATTYDFNFDVGYQI